MTFDRILPALRELFVEHRSELAELGTIIVNRDLMGRVRFIADASVEARQAAAKRLKTLAKHAEEVLGPYSYPPGEAILFEADVSSMAAPASPLDVAALPGVYVLDRLATDADWTRVRPPHTKGPARIAFYSVKGGVGRSTALAVTAWSLAQRGERVLVVDLDLESPGLSSSLLPLDRRPRYGLTDWLVEDLVANGDAVLSEMTALSELSREGEIRVVPAHGIDAGEYVAKLGRVWMPTVDDQGGRRAWPQRLERVLDSLTDRWDPTVMLFDARAGIDDAASACLTELGVHAILCFAVDSDQTWTGYEILFRHWLRTAAATKIRERLQMVAAPVPDGHTEAYVAGMRERSWDLFTTTLYDEITSRVQPSTSPSWSFDTADEDAPHYPWQVRWHRGFAALESVHGRLSDIDEHLVRAHFGKLIDGLDIIMLEHRQRQ